MNIQDMHTVFRTMGQQMGTQLNRGILPESIDAFINDVITEKVHAELLAGVHTVNQENVNLQGSTMSSINAFRTLYRTARYELTKSDYAALNEVVDNAPPPPNYVAPAPGSGVSQPNTSLPTNGTVPNEFREDENGAITHPRSVTPKVAYYNKDNGYTIFNIPVLRTSEMLDTETAKYLVSINTNKEYYINPMLFLGFSVEYDNTARGNAVSCRLIGSDVLETTFRDYCNGASFDSPIVTLSSIPNLGIDNFGYGAYEALSKTCREQLEIYTNSKDKPVRYINIKYIKTPNIVKYHTDLSKCINCDLPEYTHYDIVERAVMKFYQAIGAISSNSQRDRQREN